MSNFDWVTYESIGRVLDTTLTPRTYHSHTEGSPAGLPGHIIQYIKDAGKLRVNEYFYEMVGDNTLRKTFANGPGSYDQIADIYEDLFLDNESLEENEALMNQLGDMSQKSVLDVGCGTGLFLDYNTPTEYKTYLGFDPSGEMLNVLKRKHPWANVLQTPLASFVPHKKYDLIIALFGVGNYLDQEAALRLPSMLAKGGSMFIMYYTAYPETYIRSGVELEYRLFNENDILIPGKIVKFRNYLVVK
jgi:SAM-dependent methyltransferase